jgi:hypothetical protein
MIFLSFLIIFSGTQTLACKKIEMACQDFEGLNYFKRACEE